MPNKIDMSLDDIIKKSKTNRKPGGQGRRNSGPGKPRSQSAGGGGNRRRSIGAGGDQPRGRRRSDGGGAGVGGQRRGGVAKEFGPTKLLVSNLDSGVSDTDIRELFSEFGRLKSAAVHYDKFGKSLRTAEVFFNRRNDALKGKWVRTLNLIVAWYFLDESLVISRTIRVGLQDARHVPDNTTLLS